MYIGVVLSLSYHDVTVVVGGVAGLQNMMRQFQQGAGHGGGSHGGGKRGGGQT